MSHALPIEMLESGAVVAPPREPLPFWLPTPGSQCFAWYHPPATRGARAAAVLLCDPFGWNRMVLHLAYREVALRLAAAGFAALRIDYPGTCDSEGHPRDCARLERWLASLDAGATRLREWSGASRLVLFGALLGGTLAGVLASRRADVEGLALWGTYVQGRSMIRSELAATGAARCEARRMPPGAAAGDQEALGFLLTAEMMDDLRAVDLAALRSAGVRKALVLPRAAGAAEKKLAEQLRLAGAEVDHRPSAPDDLDALLHENGAGYPAATIEEIARWLERAFPEPCTTPAPPFAAPAPSALVQAARDRRVRETAVFLGRGGGIFGIVSEPLEPVAGRPAVVFVNGGHNHRPGINRNYTEWARSLAAHGYPVLRMDLRGLGDSPPAEPGLRAGLYTGEGTQDVLDAVHWMRSRGSRAVWCVGLCAGGYQALHAALRDPAVNGVVLLNPLRFNRDRADVARRGPAWLAHRIARRLPCALRALGPAARWVARSFRTLADRGVDVLVVYNGNERYREFFEAAVHPVRGALEASGRFRLAVVGPSDHIFSPLWAQAEVGEVLRAHFAALAERSTPAATQAPH